MVEQPADGLNNREAEADPPALIVTWIVDLVEGVEQSIQVLARNSRSTVDHINVEVRVPYADVQPDRPVLGVLEQKIRKGILSTVSAFGGPATVFRQIEILIKSPHRGAWRSKRA